MDALTDSTANRHLLQIMAGASLKVRQADSDSAYAAWIDSRHWAETHGG